MRIVATLTTIPKRIKYIKPVLDSIVNQQLKFDHIYLNIPKKTLTGKKYIIPLDLLDGFPTDLITIVRCNIDYGPITKLIPTLEYETDPETVIFIFDDDQIVHTRVSNILVKKVKKYPNCALGFSGWCLGTVPFLFQLIKKNEEDIEVDWLQGTDCIAVKRKFFNLQQLLDYSNFPKNIFLKNDDHWIAYHLELHNIKKIKINKNATLYFKPTSQTYIEPISRSITFIPTICHICCILYKKGIYKRNINPLNVVIHRQIILIIIFIIYIFIVWKSKLIS
jgi:hypothetical protein